jgi:hypothetical protein
MADALGPPGVLGFEVRPGNVPGSWIATALLFGTAPIETDVVSGILGLGRFEMSLSVEFIEGLVPSVGELVGPQIEFRLFDALWSSFSREELLPESEAIVDNGLGWKGAVGGKGLRLAELGALSRLFGDGGHSVVGLTLEFALTCAICSCILKSCCNSTGVEGALPKGRSLGRTGPSLLIDKAAPERRWR